MHITKKVLVIGVLCVAVAAAVIGGVTVANADSSGTSANQTQTAVSTLMEKVAEMYQKDTGTAIDPQALQKAFQEAGAALRADRLDQMLAKMVEEGRITQEQADQWKAWWDSRPATMLNDQYKSWLESRPEVPGLSGNNGPCRIGPTGGMRNFGFRGMMRGFSQ